jgi:glycosyltransferase involved in cell wall biosynthesis
MKNKKNIHIIISSFDDLKNPVYAGGGARAVYEVAKRLAGKYNVTVLTSTFKGAKSGRRDNVKYLYIGTDIFGPKIGQVLFQFALLKYLSKPYDIWFESSTPPFTFSLLPLFSKKPVFSWVHMLTAIDMERKYHLKFSYVESLLSKFYKNFIVPTVWVKGEIEKMNKDANIFEIPSGYEVKTSMKKQILTQEKYLLFIGRIEVNQKGLDLLLEAYSKTNQKYRLLIAGGGASSEVQKLKSLILRYGIEKKVRMLGRVTGESKENLFRGATIIVVPSRFETFGMSALEAISFGKKIVCFDIPQLSWIPKKYAIKIKKFEVGKFSKAIEKTMASNTELSREETNEFLKKFRWESIVSQFQNQIMPSI